MSSQESILPDAELLRCRRCGRLASYLEDIRQRWPDYHARPVPSFGSVHARLLIVGLAPGLHGANRTGRPFTGDHAGILLYATLHRAGFASCAQSIASGDGLDLIDCRISNAVRCVPPQNKPQPLEVKTCNAYLAREIASMVSLRAVLALGAVSHRAVLMAFKLKPGAYPFTHGARHLLPSGQALFDSYHCSRYNTQTRRLTSAGFGAVVAAIRSELDACGGARGA